MVEFPKENGGRYTGRIADGIYSATAKVKAAKAKDGQDHEIPFTFKASFMSKGMTQFEYGCLLYALDLKARNMVENPFLVTPKLSPEEKAASKERAKVKREKKAGALEAIATADVTKMNAAQIAALIAKAQAALAK